MSPDQPHDAHRLRDPWPYGVPARPTASVGPGAADAEPDDHILRGTD